MAEISPGGSGAVRCLQDLRYTREKLLEMRWGTFDGFIKRFSLRASSPGSIHGLLCEELESLFDTDMPSDSHDDTPEQSRSNIMSSWKASITPSPCTPPGTRPRLITHTCAVCIHPIPPTHLFRLVLHCKHSLPSPATTTAQKSQTCLRHSRQAKSLSSNASPVPPISVSMAFSSSQTPNPVSQSSQASCCRGCGCAV